MNKKDILNSLIQDTQESSRFIESKTAIITAIIGAILVYYLQDTENIIKYSCSFTFANYLFFILVLITTIFNVFILIKIISPIDNPKSKIPEEYREFPNLYLSKDTISIDNPNLSEFKEAFSNELNTEKAIELEYIKTSYIRNNKLSHYKILVLGIIFQILFFIIHLFIYNSELIRLTAS